MKDEACNSVPTFNNKEELKLYLIINYADNNYKSVTKKLRDQINQYMPSFLDKEDKLSRKIHHILHDDVPHINICKGIDCDNITLWDRQDKKYRDFCGNHKCTQSSAELRTKIKATLMANYGVEVPYHNDDIKERGKIKILNKYGVENPFQAESCKEKSKQTSIKKYGVGHPFQSESIKNKAKATNLKLYGVENQFQRKLVIDKSKETCIEKYGVDSYSKLLILPDTLSKLENKEWLYNEHIINKKSKTQIAEELHTYPKTVERYIKHHDIEYQLHAGTSIAERTLQEFFINNEIYFISNSRKIIDKELDIYLPQYNLAIEYNGLYWHNELNVSNNNHALKYKLCDNRGIKLITIFEDEWIHNPHLIKRYLQLLLHPENSINCKYCNIFELSILEKEYFFTSNSIMGNRYSNFNIGLENNGELVAVMGLIKRDDKYTIVQYVVVENINNGIATILEYIEQKYDPFNISIKIDLRFDDSEKYIEAGFKLDKELSPDFTYTFGSKRYHKSVFRKRKQLKKFGKYDDTLDEIENCKRNKVYRIFDCGYKILTKSYS